MKSQTITASKEEKELHWGWHFLFLVIGMILLFAFFAVPAVMGWHYVSWVQFGCLALLISYGAAH